MRGSCNACGESLTHEERRSCRRLQGRLTYPVYCSDGAVGEAAVRYLCSGCVQRAEQGRREAQDASFVGPLLIHRLPILSPGHRRGAWLYHSLGLLSVAGLQIGLFSLSLAFLCPPDVKIDETVVGREAASIPLPVPAPLISTTTAALSPPLPAPAGPLQAAPRPVAKLPPKSTPKVVAPAARLAVRVCTTTPQRSKGFWATVIVSPVPKVAAVRPTIRFRDSQGHSYRLTLVSNGRPGEWTRRFGLDTEGTWRGVAVLQAGKQKLSVKLPLIRVLPRTNSEQGHGRLEATTVREPVMPFASALQDDLQTSTAPAEQSMRPEGRLANKPGNQPSDR